MYNKDNLYFWEYAMWIMNFKAFVKNDVVVAYILCCLSNWWVGSAKDELNVSIICLRIKSYEVLSVCKALPIAG